MRVDDKTVVAIEYEIFNSNGDLIDSSDGEILEYVHGYGQLLQKWEEHMIDKEEGQEYNFTIEAKDGYGKIEHDLIAKVPKKNFENYTELCSEMKLEGRTSKGKKRPVIVKKVLSNHVLIDANHPLAGDLHFKVKIVTVKPLTGIDLEDI